MELIFAEMAEDKFRAHSEDQKKRLNAWFDYLKEWDTNPFAKSRSGVANIKNQKVYRFATTSDDLYIFYTVDEEKKTITVLDFTTRDVILASGGVP